MVDVLENQNIQNKQSEFTEVDITTLDDKTFLWLLNIGDDKSFIKICEDFELNENERFLTKEQIELFAGNKIDANSFIEGLEDIVDGIGEEKEDNCIKALFAYVVDHLPENVLINPRNKEFFSQNIDSDTSENSSGVKLGSTPSNSLNILERSGILSHEPAYGPVNTGGIGSHDPLTEARSSVLEEIENPISTVETPSFSLPKSKPITKDILAGLAKEKTNMAEFIPPATTDKSVAEAGVQQIQENTSLNQMDISSVDTSKIVDPFLNITSETPKESFMSVPMGEKRADPYREPIE